MLVSVSLLLFPFVSGLATIGLSHFGDCLAGAATPAAGCCATYPANNGGILSILVVETNAKSCQVIAGKTYYYEDVLPGGSFCLMPSKANCQDVIAQGVAGVSGSFVQCNQATTKTVDNVINAQAMAGIHNPCTFLIQSYVKTVVQI